MIKESGYDIVCGVILIFKDVYLCGVCKVELLLNINWCGIYSFIVCSKCGLWFFMLWVMLYDRKNMSMLVFLMCELCCKEY